MQRTKKTGPEPKPKPEPGTGGEWPAVFKDTRPLPLLDTRCGCGATLRIEQVARISPTGIFDLAAQFIDAHHCAEDTRPPSHNRSWP